MPPSVGCGYLQKKDNQEEVKPMMFTLVSVKRIGGHLFLRYAFTTKETTR